RVDAVRGRRRVARARAGARGRRAGAGRRGAGAGVAVPGAGGGGVAARVVPVGVAAPGRRLGAPAAPDPADGSGRGRAAAAGDWAQRGLRPRAHPGRAAAAARAAGVRGHHVAARGGARAVHAAAAAVAAVRARAARERRRVPARQQRHGADFRRQLAQQPARGGAALLRAGAEQGAAQRVRRGLAARGARAVRGAGRLLRARRGRDAARVCARAAGVPAQVPARGVVCGRAGDAGGVFAGGRRVAGVRGAQRAAAGRAERVGGAAHARAGRGRAARGRPAGRRVAAVPGLDGRGAAVHQAAAPARRLVRQGRRAAAGCAPAPGGRAQVVPRPVGREARAHPRDRAVARGAVSAEAAVARVPAVLLGGARVDVPRAGRRGAQHRERRDAAAAGQPARPALCARRRRSGVRADPGARRGRRVLQGAAPRRRRRALRKSA
ncbi:hypothetical protein IWW55_006683, partial [Coemansia sp. RSA 2706]